MLFYEATVSINLKDYTSFPELMQKRKWKYPTRVQCGGGSSQ